jgi:hypothetical protein
MNSGRAHLISLACHEQDYHRIHYVLAAAGFPQYIIAAYGGWTGFKSNAHLCLSDATYQCFGLPTYDTLGNRPPN